MNNRSAAGEFTGKHMAVVLVAGFGIVAAVNFFMASLATGGFHGVVVENSYVASQKFNSWLDEAKRMEALGWTVESRRDEKGHVLLSANGVPAAAAITAELRRPLGNHEFASLTFVEAGEGQYRSVQPVSKGRWIMRLRVEAGDNLWTQESELR